MRNLNMILIGSFLVLFFSHNLNSQRVSNPDFDKKIDRLIDYKVPVVSVQEVFGHYEKYTFLDTRELKEYDVSHIPNAKYIGFKNFDATRVVEIPKKDTIIVYCSIGYRSDIIGKKLEKAGYENVYNLYGSIFEWANCDYPLEDSNSNKTMKLHTYNKKWSKWVDNPRIEKVW